MNEIEKLIAKAIFEGVANATIIPVIIFNLTNYFVKGSFGGVVALVYIILAATLYFMSKKRDISRFAFFITSTFVYGGWIMLLIISAMLAGLGGSY